MRSFAVVAALLCISLPPVAVLSASEHWPDRIIVKFDETAIPLLHEGDRLLAGDAVLNQILSRYAIEVDESLFPGVESSPEPAVSQLSRIHRLRFAPGSDYLGAMEALQASPAVEYAELDIVVYPLETPNDPMLSDQWHLETVMAVQAWDVAHGSGDVAIAIVDSGIQLVHPDLAANFWSNPDEIDNGLDDDGNGLVDDILGWDYIDGDNQPGDDVRCNHGTHVAGIAAAVTNNAVGVAGMSWNCRIMNLRMMAWSEAAQNCVGSIGDSILAINYAVAQGASVINLSIGHGGQHSAERDAVNYAFSQGLVLAGAAGNGGSDGIGDPQSDYPGGYENVITVGNTSRSDRKSSSSNYGAEIDVMAPGSRIMSTYMPNTYDNASGTSMSSPLVAGLAALIMATGESDPATVKMRIKGGAENIDAQNAEWVGMLGAGRINAYYSITPGSLVMPVAAVMDDQNGDRDFQADSGETVDITMTFKNQSWRDATGVQAVLVDAGPHATIVQDASTVGAVASKEEVETSTAYRITVAAGAPFNSTVPLTFEITADDGTNEATFTISLNDPHPAMPGWPKPAVSNDFNSSPVMVDLDGDGGKELVLADNARQLFVWRYDGSNFPGWPLMLPDADNHIALSTPAIGDLDGDGDPEIVAASFRIAAPDATPPYPAQGKLYVFHTDGTMVAGWPRVYNEEIKASPALFDLNGDGK
ncbi:S8 family serine peptidase, partial [bacterium]|nr:S8 family serine peptidase [candidate division CSSED10-310 bacterium]